MFGGVQAGGQGAEHLKHREIAFVQPGQGPHSVRPRLPLIYLAQKAGQQGSIARQALFHSQGRSQ